MVIKIEKGVTIIDTGDAVGGVKNKTGHTGITYKPEGNVYRASIFIKKKRYHLGDFSNIADAVAIRSEAEKHRASGNFLKWFDTLYGVTKGKPRKRSVAK